MKLGYKIAALFMLAVLFLPQLYFAAGSPPPPPTNKGNVPCFPPPCIPVDNGIICFGLAAFILGTYYIIKVRKIQTN